MENNLPSQPSNHDTSIDRTEHDDVAAPRAHEAPDSVATTPDDDHPTATATARQAIEIARTLSKPMHNALKFAWTDKDDVLRLDNGVAKMRTRDALRRRELVDGSVVSNLGRIVRAVLLTSEADVLAHAEKLDAIGERERTRTAKAERRAFSAEEDCEYCANCGTLTAVHATDTRSALHPTAEACGKQQDECEGVPMRPITDWQKASWQDWVTHVRRYREAADMNELHARALTENEDKEPSAATSTSRLAIGTETTDRAIAADKIPDTVIDVIRAAAAFEDTVQRVGTAELAQAASGLGTVHLAYLFDRLDDTRNSIAEILSAMLDVGLTELDDSAPTVSEAHGDLENAGHGLLGVINELDPASARHNLTIL